MDVRLIIDPARCTGTGVCLSISPQLRLVDGLATCAVGIDAAVAADAAACCPNQAITVHDDGHDRFDRDCPIVTLGPEGTDAHAEASRHSGDVRLVASFADAMAAATRDWQVRALIAAGYLAVDRDGRTLDSWVDQHFSHTGVLELLRCWQSPTKPMCLAVRTDLGRGTVIGSVATHPATRFFARRYAPAARHVTVEAKPLAAHAAARGQVQACIASVDIVARYPQLEVRAEFAPTMVWMLYGKQAAQ
ncbi:ferredoxin [Nocardia noduli]|uniref:ferredoxin n=1 Tax=Nocardia noduli TaxID=2815722 RepID=UPI001C21D8C8|nr:ferredoxin [Nocardia noduli]